MFPGCRISVGKMKARWARMVVRAPHSEAAHSKGALFFRLRSHPRRGVWESLEGGKRREKLYNCIIISTIK